MGVDMPEGDVELGPVAIAVDPRVGMAELDSLLTPKPGRASMTEGPIRLAMFLPDFPFVIFWIV